MVKLSNREGQRLFDSGFVWFHDIGVGYYPVQESDAPYDADYFKRYQAQADTPMGHALMKSRLDFVRRHYKGGDLLDVGIGCGAFITWCHQQGQKCKGFDVNPAGREWLERRGLWQSPYEYHADAVTLWDVFEHIPNFSPLLECGVGEWAFMSLPIFRNAHHARGSKHFRTDEHYWYFTPEGLREVMAAHGFKCVEEHREETVLGREDIGSFAFRRV